MTFVFFLLMAALAVFTVGSEQEVVSGSFGTQVQIYLKWWVWLLIAAAIETLEKREGKLAFIPMQVALATVAVSGVTLLYPRVSLLVSLILIVVLFVAMQILLAVAKFLNKRMMNLELKPWQELGVNAERYASTHKIALPKKTHRSYWSLKDPSSVPPPPDQWKEEEMLLSEEYYARLHGANSVRPDGERTYGSDAQRVFGARADRGFGSDERSYGKSSGSEAARGSFSDKTPPSS